MDKVELRIRILLATQTALLGAIDARVRAVTCRWDNRHIQLRVIIDGRISVIDRETMSMVETEIMSHFHAHEVNVECVRVDVPQRIELLPNEVLVFSRREDS